MATDVFRNNRLCKIFGITYPVIQAGMVWVSGAKLAAAAANSGCLGVIGAGSMKPDVLRQHIMRAQQLTTKPLAVNVPLFFQYCEEQIAEALELGIRIFITSAGSPKTYTAKLHAQGCKVAHVVSSPALAKKCEEAGVDVVIAEGFEAGGHNGRDEITTMVLVPQVVDAIKVPVVAAGGIGDGRGIAAALALGAEGVQLGTRFLATQGASAHQRFKEAVLAADATATHLCMKELVPVRLLKNPFWERIREIEQNPQHTREQLLEALGKGRARQGMLEGDLMEGELEVGQVAGLIKDLPTVAEMVQRILGEFEATCQRLSDN